jgi:hypothetical protein
VFETFVGQPLRRLRRIWEDNIKWDLMDVPSEVMNLIAGSGSCPVAGFRTSSLEPSDSLTVDAYWEMCRDKVSSWCWNVKGKIKVKLYLGLI